MYSPYVCAVDLFLHFIRLLEKEKHLTRRLKLAVKKMD